MTASPPSLSFHVPPQTGRRAFTLLELLVCVSLIGLLATITVPLAQKFMGQARASHCIGNLRELGSALQLCLADNNNTFPSLVIARKSSHDDQPAIDNTLNAYTGGNSVFCCKADNKQLYAITGTSYLWNNLLNGQNAASPSFMGFINQNSRIPVIGDKEDFHKHRDVKVNILYADGHVAKEIQFAVDAPRAAP